MTQNKMKMKADMRAMIASFPKQIREAVEIGRKNKVERKIDRYANIYIAGMGGSAIGAEFMRAMTQAHLPLPVIIGKGYEVPAFVNARTLTIISSYSGNTEETLAALQEISENRRSHIVCISSGGRMAQFAEERGYDLIKLPAGWPSPRACLGYSFVIQLFVLKHLGLYHEAFESDLLISADVLEHESDSIQKKADELAGQIWKNNLVIYSEDRLEAIAIRLRQQINENSKLLCSHHVIPEMNHNELVGWKEKQTDHAVLFLEDGFELLRNQTRIALVKEIVLDRGARCHVMKGEGKSQIERWLHLIHLGDWLSLFLAIKRGVDPVEIGVIDFLKSKLAETSS